MGTKWKNRMKLICWLLLFTFGVKGVLNGLSLLPYENDYLKRDYFQTREFEAQYGEFMDYLSFFELNAVTKEEAKNAITVSDSEIDEHRYRYGDLSEQIENITAQYEERIRKAAEDNEELATIYIAERDKKIEDIRNNFIDDNHVREKVIREKEQKIDEYYKNIEKVRPQFLRFKEMFTYYLTDTETKKVYTNVNDSNHESIKEIMNKDQMLFIRSYPTSQNGYFTQTENFFDRFGYEEHIVEWFQPNEAKTFTGYVGISNSLPATSPVMINYHNHKQKQLMLLIYIISSIIALVVSLYLYKRTQMDQLLSIEKWRSYYHRVPLDIKFVSFVVSCMITFGLLTSFNPFYYFQQNVFYMIKEMLGLLIFSALLLTLSFVQGKLLFKEIKTIQNFKEEWQKSILYLSYQVGSRIFHEVFLIRSIGFQLIVLLAIVGISFGVMLITAVAEPNILPLFILAFIVIGIPILLFMILRIAYLNKIMNHVNELVKGNLHSDLPIKGRSVFAQLAKNINTLKHGVQSSQIEQAKSERLKTELITNVSHDLRTPLTSIITYTELLKGTNHFNEDQKSYLEIIDRKSKRLKALIDDLFEASKMASGNVELVKEKVDIVQLLQQALAEYNEAINQASLQLRFKKPDIPVYVVVDGQKLWRVFDNLIGNMMKYSLEGTRVYISVNTEQDHVKITFKNVTKYELGENIDELFERFKRGDTSRHTDGSGLGLAIAKSIVDLHHGRLDIELDGDLFKVTVTISTK